MELNKCTRQQIKRKHMWMTKSNALYSIQLGKRLTVCIDWLCILHRRRWCQHLLFDGGQLIPQLFLAIFGLDCFACVALFNLNKVTAKSITFFHQPLLFLATSDDLFVTNTANTINIVVVIGLHNRTELLCNSLGYAELLLEFWSPPSRQQGHMKVSWKNFLVVNCRCM